MLQDILVGQHYDDNKKLQQHWYIDGLKVCYSFYLAARGYSHKFVNKYRKKLKETNSSLGSVFEFTQNDGKSFRNQSSPKKEHFIAWLQVFSEKVGDYMPDETATVLPLSYPKFE